MEPELRDWYLSTLGIVQYRLHAGPQNPQNPQSLAVEHPGIEQGTALEGHELSSSGAAVLSELSSALFADERENGRVTKSLGKAQEGQVDTQAVEQASSPALDTSLQALENPVSFRLACWRPSEDLLVLDSWPIGQAEDHQLSQLLKNIIKSIKRCPDVLMQPEFIDWPFSSECSLPAARDHIAMFLQGRHDQQAFQWVLAMGDDSRLCLDDGPMSDDKRSRLPLDCGGEVIFTHSLSDMLAEPVCKKDVWAAIRFLAS